MLKKNIGLIINLIKKSFIVFKNFFGRTHSSIFYIGSGENLPAPLSETEEKYLINQLDKKDSQAKSKLIEHNLRLVVYIARKFENTGINIEDLISIGAIGLIKAINTFCTEKNIKLATYASRCIENEILMYLRRNLKTKNEISIDEPLNSDCEGNELLLSDVLGTDNNIVSEGIEYETYKNMLFSAIDKLNEREKQIVQLRYGLYDDYAQEMTQKEVADMLGISQSYISRIEKRIIIRLKREMAKLA